MFYDTQRHKAECKAKAEAENLTTRKLARAGVEVADLVMKLDSVLSGKSHRKEVLDAALHQDMQALKQHTDVAKRIELKKTQLIPKWLPVMQDYRDNGQHFPFEALVWFVIWLLDADQIDKCIEFADLAIEQQQKLPAHFTSSSLDTFIAEGIHDWAQRQFKNGHSAEPFLSDVLERVETKQWLVTEPIALNKIYKLVAQFADHNNESEKAEAFYLKCVAVNPEKHGVKGALTNVQKKLGKPLTFE
jgi:hypothetical protein